MTIRIRRRLRTVVQPLDLDGSPLHRRLRGARRQGVPPSRAYPPAPVVAVPPCRPIPLGPRSLPHKYMTSRVPLSNPPVIHPLVPPLPDKLNSIVLREHAFQEEVRRTLRLFRKNSSSRSSIAPQRSSSFLTRLRRIASWPSSSMHSQP